MTSRLSKRQAEIDAFMTANDRTTRELYKRTQINTQLAENLLPTQPLSSLSPAENYKFNSLMNEFETELQGLYEDVISAYDSKDKDKVNISTGGKALFKFNSIMIFLTKIFKTKQLSQKEKDDIAFKLDSTIPAIQNIIGSIIDLANRDPRHTDPGITFLFVADLNNIMDNIKSRTYKPIKELIFQSPNILAELPDRILNRYQNFEDENEGEEEEELEGEEFEEDLEEENLEELEEEFEGSGIRGGAYLTAEEQAKSLLRANQYSSSKNKMARKEAEREVNYNTIKIGSGIRKSRAIEDKKFKVISDLLSSKGLGKKATNDIMKILGKGRKKQ